MTVLPDGCVDGPALVRELMESGWDARVRGNHVALTRNGRTVAVPAERYLARSVHQVIRARIAEIEAEEHAARLAAPAERGS